MENKPKLANHMAEAREEAVRLTRKRIIASGIFPIEAGRRVGLPVMADGSVEISVLGQPHRVTSDSFLVANKDGFSAHPVDEMLILRYLEFDREVKPLEQEITFRELPGGPFYYGPISKRTTDLLAKTFGNDCERLRKALQRYPHEPLQLGDVSARIHAIGQIDVTLVYHSGDEEFAPEARLIYDKIIGSVYTTDEVCSLLTRMCIGLLRP